MARRILRCEECRHSDTAYCIHNHVLLMFVDGFAMLVQGATEGSARRTADKVRIAFRGAPFHRNRTAQTQLCDMQ